MNQNKITLDRDRILTYGFHQFQELEVPKKLACLTPYEKFVTQLCLMRSHIYLILYS